MNSELLCFTIVGLEKTIQKVATSDIKEIEIFTLIKGILNLTMEWLINCNKLFGWKTIN